ncbi:alcohol dehydrogenase [Haloferula helveola]|uniref:enoyl-[acyl-carrier-protein] reductase n=1 Tax=Haloferula helveola TaxID=490095 RepID=A0ABN6H5E6_9BACT|nr:alcohol dehydrogenase [Haloferula helveola]
MKILRFSTFGQAADVLSLEDHEPASLNDGDVRLRVLASPINPADLNFIEGTYGVKPELPAVAGIEGCAEVTESRSAEFAPGDRCIFIAQAELWAEETVVPASTLVKLPAGIDPVQAAMLKVNPATAWQMLTGFATLPEGSWVVQNAANSGVGQSVIQLAPLLGLRTINLVRRESLFDELKALGADHVLLDDSDGVDAAKSICGSDRPALALNAVGGDSALRLMNILGPGGIHVTYGAMGRKPLKVPNGLLIFKNLQLRGFWLTEWLRHASVDEVRGVYQRLAEVMADGKLKLPVDSTHPLADFAAAFARNGSPERDGKVLFVP